MSLAPSVFHRHPVYHEQWVLRRRLNPARNAFHAAVKLLTFTASQKKRPASIQRFRLVTFLVMSTTCCAMRWSSRTWMAVTSVWIFSTRTDNAAGTIHKPSGSGRVGDRDLSYAGDEVLSLMFRIHSTRIVVLTSLRFCSCSSFL